MTRPLRILVVEDNRINQMLAVQMLHQLGHHGTVVGDGAQALQCLRSRTFDVVLLDVLMPVQDGWQTLSKLRGSVFPKLREAKVIVTTSMDEREEVDRLLAAGANEYVPKPLVATRLAQALERLGLA